VRLAPLRSRAAVVDNRRWVTPEELNVAPALLGLPLARPGQRLVAMGIDLAAIGTLSSLANGWFFLAGLLGLGERALFRRHGPHRLRTVVAWGLAALMAFAGLREAMETPSKASRPLAASEGLDDDDDDEATARNAALVVSMIQGASPASAIAATAASRAPAASAASAPDEAASDAATIAGLRQQVRTLKLSLAHERAAAEQALKSQNWRERVRRLGLDFGIGYGWALAYFTLLPGWWRGQTIGKRLMGLRVVEITGKPMATMLNLKRFGGYLAGMATGGLGLVQLVWDPNRQALQDKAAHTVVVDERRPKRSPQAVPDLFPDTSP
jgi:uncharacterized RDD family membrane protein YckC